MGLHMGINQELTSRGCSQGRASPPPRWQHGALASPRLHCTAAGGRRGSQSPEGWRQEAQEAASSTTAAPPEPEWPGLAPGTSTAPSVKRQCLC